MALGCSPSCAFSTSRISVRFRTENGSSMLGCTLKRWRSRSLTLYSATFGLRAGGGQHATPVVERKACLPACSRRVQWLMKSPPAGSAQVMRGRSKSLSLVCALVNDRYLSLSIPALNSNLIAHPSIVKTVTCLGYWVGTHTGCRSRQAHIGKLAQQLKRLTDPFVDQGSSLRVIRADMRQACDVLIARLQRPNDGQFHAAMGEIFFDRRITLRASRMTSECATVAPAENSASARRFS